MDKDITPYVPVPSHTDLELYKQTLIERFGNHYKWQERTVSAWMAFSKFPVYIMPNLIKMIRDHADTVRVAYLIAYLPALLEV